MDALTGLLPSCEGSAETLLARIATPNWALEWGLADWVALPLGLSPEVARRLQLANLFTLAWARLTDDLADGEWRPATCGEEDEQRDESPAMAAQRSEAVVLAAGLHQLLLRQYLRLFQQHEAGGPGSDRQGTTEVPLLSRFWDYADRFVGEWLEATIHEGAPVRARSGLGRVELLEQASRGAFLKIVCAAACLLADREEAILTFGAALDHLLVGVVMLDDLFDWAEDLEGSRHNVLVAYCSALPQTEAYREANRQAVLSELYLGEAAAGYFEHLREHLQEADRWAQTADCPGLRDFIGWYDQEVVACGGWVTDRAVTALSGAAERWLDGAVANHAETRSR